MGPIQADGYLFQRWELKLWHITQIRMRPSLLGIAKDEEGPPNHPIGYLTYSKAASGWVDFAPDNAQVRSRSTYRFNVAASPYSREYSGPMADCDTYFEHAGFVQEAICSIESHSINAFCVGEKAII